LQEQQEQKELKILDDMKKILKFSMIGMIACIIQSHDSFGQQIDEERMKRDIEVAENVLATLIKQEINQQRTIFGLDVKGSYQPGYGVTFRLPGESSMPFVFYRGNNNVTEVAPVISNENGFSYSIGTNEPGDVVAREEDRAFRLADKASNKRRFAADSLRADYNNKVIKAAKDFILDYGDFVSQLGANEKIIVTNQGDRHQFYFNSGKRTRISVEGTKADILAVKEGKLSREQGLKKLTVLNTESVETTEPDIEMLSSIFSRLYRYDLSKTYFTEGNVYYEKLKDYGTIFYMQMVSSVRRDENTFSLPTAGLDNLDKKARDKKVAELYPAFEKDFKENILEYGRTLKSLKDDELLIFNIGLTECTQCGIPSTLELGIKSSVLKEYSSGKIDKSAAQSKFIVKKGSNQ
jgi:hypothetical protein